MYDTEANFHLASWFPEWLHPKRKWMHEINIWCLTQGLNKSVIAGEWSNIFTEASEPCLASSSWSCRWVLVAQAPVESSCLQPRKVSWKAADVFLTLVWVLHTQTFCLPSALPVSSTTSTTTSTCWQMSSSTSAQPLTPSSTTWCQQTSARSSSPRSPSCACHGGRRRNDWPSPGNPTASPATTHFPARSQGKLRTEARGGGGGAQFVVESKLERGLCDFHAWSPNSRNTNVFSKVIFVGKNRLCSASNFEVIFEHWPCLLWVMSTCIVTSVWRKSRCGVNWEAKMGST